mmetsp:Transcript_46140/g.103757  ORF Transcript_46140/g.103757 Transcript_46140/m.103757 type:complete len:213 (-) Transcript_46140:94-732(-)
MSETGRSFRSSSSTGDLRAVPEHGPLPRSASAASLGGSKYTISAKEPSYAEAFYGTSNGGYKGHWHDGTRGDQMGHVPKISDVLGARPTIRKPVRPLVTTARTILADTIKQEKMSQQGDKVLSADRLPKKFPTNASDYCYPPSAKRGTDNPLYETTGMAYGKEAPDWHQIPDRYFPSNNNFTKEFVETKPRYTGLNCVPSLSKVHVELDQRY